MSGNVNFRAEAGPRNVPPMGMDHRSGEADRAISDIGPIPEADRVVLQFLPFDDQQISVRRVDASTNF